MRALALPIAYSLLNIMEYRPDGLYVINQVIIDGGMCRSTYLWPV